MSGDLAAFLAARLDEDESGWKQVAAREDGVSEPISRFFGAVLAARMLREVAAKRAILAIYLEADKDYGEFDIIRVNHMRRTVKLLAAVYSDHPDYRQEWAP